MRVLMVSHSYLPADHRGKLRWLATHGGIELTLASPPWLHLSTGPRLVFENLPEPFRVRLLRPVAFGHHNALRLYGPRQVATLINEVQPHVIHVEAEPHSLSLGLLAALKPRFNYRLVAFTWENILRRGRPPLGWLERLSLRRVDWMITGNQQAQAVVRRRGYSGPTAVIPQLGVDPCQFHPDDQPEVTCGALPTRPRIGFVGRLVPEKGILDLLEAYAPISQRASLVLVGEGPVGDVARRWATQAGLADRIALTGHVPYGRIPAYLQMLDILVLPSRTTSRWREQFGHVLIEAMAAGVPVIGSDSGSIPEVIGRAGLIFPEGDVSALREHLVFLLDHPMERGRLVEAGQRRVLRYYTSQAIARATWQVYRQVREG